MQPSFPEVTSINGLANVSVQLFKEGIKLGKGAGELALACSEVVECAVSVGSAKGKLSEFTVDLVGSDDLKRPKVFKSGSP